MVISKTFDLIVNAFGDLVTKLRKMLNQFSKISNNERMPDDQINNILPPEILDKILKLLNFNDICRANLVCRRWNEIIVNGNVLKKSSGKTSTK